MKEMLKMFLILSILSGVSGGLLAMVKDGTSKQIEMQQLKFEKLPIIKKIFNGASNDPMQDKFKLNYQNESHQFFIGNINNQKNIIFETKGKGFGGDIGVMVGVDLSNNKIIGVGVTKHSETPGLGSRAKTDLKFLNQFTKFFISDNFASRQDGGKIDALSGATVTTRGVCAALNNANSLYDNLKDKIKLEVLKK